VFEKIENYFEGWMMKSTERYCEKINRRKTIFTIKTRRRTVNCALLARKLDCNGVKGVVSLWSVTCTKKSKRKT
jgi:hypothetical protein